MYLYIMLRTQISLSEDERQILDKVSAETGRSISALIRYAVDLAYGRGASIDDDLETMQRAFGAWNDRPLDGAAHVDSLRTGRRLKA